MMDMAFLWVKNNRIRQPHDSISTIRKNLGRIVPKKRVGFLFELGFQFQKTPEVYTDYGSISDLLDEAGDNEFTDIMDQLTVYPVLRFRLCGRLF